ncbi:MAG: reverse transcriptase domain-containing protein [Nostoc sp.]|uniref:reverse transcriptase domain-containing protein n=1 Tax=Nostoc sp. TaxID=1180 RepID=UPI002FFC1339
MKGFFDNIAHESILTMMENFPKRELIKGWLKAGFVFQGEFNPTEQADFSRDLENLSPNLSPARREALNSPPSLVGKGAGGLGSALAFPHDVKSQTEQGTPQGGVISPLLANIGLHGLENYIKATNPKFGVVRYADDFIVTAKDRKSLETAQDLIQAWMSKRGLELSAEKTQIMSMEDGFDFLGFNSRHYDGKLLIKPSKKKVLAFCKRIGEEVKNL